jgi:fructose-bisphosphate aldolase, class II
VTLSTTAALVDAAVEQRSAVLGFNVILLEHAEAIADGATRAGAGVLLQVSENAIRYHEGRARPLLAACAEIAASAGVPIAVHLDHIEDLDLAGELVAATDLGIGSIMIDAARLPTDDNVRVTRDIAARARVANLWVEAELGRTGGKEGAHTPGVRTDPQEAEWFVEQTGVDGLAVAVGSSHAMTDRTAELDVDLIAELAARVPVPLVLHGSSGVSDDSLRRAVDAGIRKVNVGTALNTALTAQVRAVLGRDESVTDPRRYLAPARTAMSDTVARFVAAVAR